MNKNELCKKLAKKLNITIKEADMYVSMITDTMIEGLGDGEKISIRDFGTIETFESKPTVRKVPSTGETVEVPSKTRIRFKPSAKMVEVTKNAHNITNDEETE